MFGGYGKIAKSLLARGADMESRNILGETPLVLGMRLLYGDTLLYWGRQPSRVLTNNSDHRVASYLLKEGAKVDSAGMNGVTALHYAALAGSEVMTQKIIDAG